MALKSEVRQKYTSWVKRCAGERAGNWSPDSNHPHTCSPVKDRSAASPSADRGRARSPRNTGQRPRSSASSPLWPAIRRTALTVVVTDTGPERPPLVPRSPHPDSPTGRGLVIVDAFSHPLGDHPATRQPRQGRVVGPRPAPAATATRLTSQRRTAITELAARSARQLGGHPSLPRLERRPITRLREKSSDPTERTGSPSRRAHRRKDDLG